MSDLPFNIPKSLASYAEHFKNDPLNATTRLKKQLKKRGPDAVGYFLLSWFYHLKGMEGKAVEEALKAKTLAPGSPFIEKLHYYLSHPNTFDAWQPVETVFSSSKEQSSSTSSGPVLEDLDMLIQQLSEVESAKVTLNKGPKISKGSKLSDDSDGVDNIFSETLAKIHAEQGKTKAAITIYERLKMLKTEKKNYYQEQISRLQKVKQTDEEE